MLVMSVTKIMSISVKYIKNIFIPNSYQQTSMPALWINLLPKSHAKSINIANAFQHLTNPSEKHYKMAEQRKEIISVQWGQCSMKFNFKTVIEFIHISPKNLLIYNLKLS